MTLLQSLDRLNSWVRSDSARSSWSSPRYAIYDWKNHLLERAIINGAECSAIHLSLTCRSCAGTGRFTDWNGHTYPDCRKCGSSGVVRLRFCVTRIGEFVWHTPERQAWRFRLPVLFWDSARLSMDWEPNAKGRDLEPWQVAECLNVCEQAVASGELCKPSSHSAYEDIEISHGKYKLHLGRGRRVCEVCGSVAPADETDYSEGMMHGVITEHLSWSAWACNACRYRNSGAAIFEVLKGYPPGEVRHPEIQKWLERRGVMEGWC